MERLYLFLACSPRLPAQDLCEIHMFQIIRRISILTKNIISLPHIYLLIRKLIASCPSSLDSYSWTQFDDYCSSSDVCTSCLRKFSAIASKGDNLSDFLFARQTTSSFLKKVNS